VLGLEAVIVDAKHHRVVRLILGRRAEHDLFGPGFQVIAVTALLARTLGEHPGRFQRDVHPHLAPGQVGRAPLAEDLDRLAVDQDGVAFRLDRPGEASVNGVVFEQQSQRLGVGEIVDRHHFKLVRPRRHRAKRQTSNPTESVDTDFDRHRFVLQRKRAPRRPVRGQSHNPSAQL
jgi:hypothetical protein